MSAVAVSTAPHAPARHRVELGAWTSRPASAHESLWHDRDVIGLGGTAIRWADLVWATIATEDHAGVVTHRLRLASRHAVLELSRSSVRGYRKDEDRRAAAAVLVALHRFAPPHVVATLPAPA